MGASQVSRGAARRADLRELLQCRAEPDRLGKGASTRMDAPSRARARESNSIAAAREGSGASMSGQFRRGRASSRDSRPSSFDSSELATATVERVDGQWKAHGREVHTDLVRSAGERLDRRSQREAPQALHGCRSRRVRAGLAPFGGASTMAPHCACSSGAERRGRSPRSSPSAERDAPPPPGPSTCFFTRSSSEGRAQARARRGASLATTKAPEVSLSSLCTARSRSGSGSPASPPSSAPRLHAPCVSAAPR